MGPRAIPAILCHDGRTISYPDPDIRVMDTIKYDFHKGKILQVVHFKVGALCMITAGKNIGRVGVIEDVEKHPGSFDMVHVRDVREQQFATRKDNIFVIGSGTKALITLPKTQGIKYSNIEDREQRLERQANPKHNQNRRKELSGPGKTLLPPRTMEVAKRTREKKRLLRILRQQEKKSSKGKPKKASSKKKGDE